MTLRDYIHSHTLPVVTMDWNGFAYFLDKVRRAPFSAPGSQISLESAQPVVWANPYRVYRTALMSVNEEAGFDMSPKQS